MSISAHGVIATCLNYSMKSCSRTCSRVQLRIESTAAPVGHRPRVLVRLEATSREYPLANIPLRLVVHLPRARAL